MLDSTMKYILLLSISLLLASCSTAFEETLHTTLKLSDDKMGSVQELEATFTVVNGTSETKTIKFTTGCQFAFTIEKDGREVFNLMNLALCTQALTEIVLDPSGKIEFEISISQEFVLAPGKYQLKAFLIGHDNLESSKTFTIN